MTLAAAPRTAPEHRWRPLRPNEDEGASLPESLHPVVRRVLGARGHTTPAEAQAFLEPRWQDADPLAMADMAVAVERLRAAVARGEEIVVYGDYDVDGVSATAVLLETLRSLGGNAQGFLPHRERDGYGVAPKQVDRLVAAGARVLVTVDCGIRGAEALEAASRRGVDVIVTDHHAVPATLPDVLAVIDPRRPDCAYPFPDLAGVGLAFRLAQALLAAPRAGAAGGLDPRKLLDLVALGTVADVVPLVGENRALVKSGLAEMRRGGRPGLRALVVAADVAPEAIRSRTLAWDLAPQLNAAGRLASAAPALDLLLTATDDRARELARELRAYNRRRRALTKAAVAEAEGVLDGCGVSWFLLHEAKHAPVGVLGLVASRLCDRHRRPAAVARREGDVVRASVRSVPGFNVAAALDGAADLFLRHGGHAMAGGFTARAADLPRIRARLEEAARLDLAALDLRPELKIDAAVAPGEIDDALWQAFEVLEPFGEGNPEPLLLVAGAIASDVRVVGADHLAFRIAGGGGKPVKAIAFRQGARAAGLEGRQVDIVATLRVNSWRGRTNLELGVQDLAVTGAGGR